MLKTIVNEALNMAYERGLDNVAHTIEETPANFYNEVFGHCDTPEEVIEFIQDVHGFDCGEVFMKNYEVYANGVLVDTIVAPEGYTAENYKEECERNGWDFAPCSETDEIELKEV